METPPPCPATQTPPPSNAPDKAWLISAAGLSYRIALIMRFVYPWSEDCALVF